MADDIISSGMRKRDRDEAIESLFYACYPHLVRTAFGLTGDWDLAEQLAQDAYLRLWRRWRWIADPQAAPAYLQRTVVNLARETIRRRVLERRVLHSRSTPPPRAAAPDPAADLDLRRAVAALPARKRACVVLRYLVGMSEAETAEVLGVSVGTVKSQTHKGLRQLRDGLTDGAATTGRASATEETAK
jgi:RNA polymerase sigma-70 factor (sigma-E family)